MKKQLVALVGAVTVCMMLAVVSNAMAADPNRPKGTPKDKSKEQMVVGLLSVTKDNDGNFTEIKVTVIRNLIYRVVLDEKGKELGKALADKRVKIVGTVEKKGEVEWVTVKTFSEAKSQLPTRPDRTPNPKPAPKPNQ
jgi:hypothetical protein